MCGCNRKTYPIVLVQGDSPPKLVGEEGRYLTGNGTVIHHPSAYSKKGWSNMTYRGSTIRIEVGVRWIAEQMKAENGIMFAISALDLKPFSDYI